MRLLSIGETVAELGVAVGTLRRWHRQGLLKPYCRTVVGHRRYPREEVRTALGAEPAAAGKAVCYARVSSHDQAEQLKTQAARQASCSHQICFIGSKDETAGNQL